MTIFIWLDNYHGNCPNAAVWPPLQNSFHKKDTDIEIRICKRKKRRWFDNRLTLFIFATNLPLIRKSPVSPQRCSTLVGQFGCCLKSRIKPLAHILISKIPIKQRIILDLDMVVFFSFFSNEFHPINNSSNHTRSPIEKSLRHVVTFYNSTSKYAPHYHICKSNFNTIVPFVSFRICFYLILFTSEKKTL